MTPLIPLLGLAAIAAFALGGKKDEASAGPQAPGGHPGVPGGPIPGNLWDANLTPAEVLAIQNALTHETSADALDRMAQLAIQNGHPMAAAALSARAMQLRLAAFIPGMPQAQPPLNQPAPHLPAPENPQPLPPLVIPPIPNIPFPLPVPVAPASNQQPAGTLAIVTTHDTGAAGRLLVRSSPQVLNAGDGTTPLNQVGKFAHGAQVLITGPITNGFAPVAGVGEKTTGDFGPQGQIAGFANASFLQPMGGAPAPIPSPAQNPLGGLLGQLGNLGGLVQPAGFPGGTAPVLSTATVTTAQAGDAGRLAVRATPGGTQIGQVGHGATVILTGPITAGFYPISGKDVNTGLPIAGFAGAAFITPNPMPSSVSAGFVPSANAIEGDLFQVATQNGDLGLRAAPNAQAPYIARAPRGAQFASAGQAQNGFVPLRDDGGKLAWAFLGSLRKIGTPITAGMTAPKDDVGAGPSLPFAELHESALGLKVALSTHGCRSYNEPIVKRFQAAAKASKLYGGDVDGWYGPTTKDALGRLLGGSPPECFAEKGGPKNAQEYWSPMGV